MQEEGMITADEYFIDCVTCGHERCVYTTFSGMLEMSSR
jgi:hypothetical protein